MFHNIFITGGTGYLGRYLIPRLIERGHTIRTLVRRGSGEKIPKGCEVIEGNALDAASYSRTILPSDTFIHLVGVPHPGPAKAEEFKTIDLVSIKQAVEAVKNSTVRHFLYLSVAQPSPVLKPYVDVRMEGEALVRGTGLNATMMRPFYVLGPGHWWPYLILPAYWICKMIPSKREAAIRLEPVTLSQMIKAMVHAIENPPEGIQIVDAPKIKGLNR